MSLDDINKSNIWTISATELSQMILEAKKQKRDEFLENEKHYMNIIRTVFDVQYLRRDDHDKVYQLETSNYQVFLSPDEGGNNAIAIRKHPIKKVTDLTLENIQHLEAWEVLELIKNNMGTGWKGLPLAIQDIIESAFFVDCTVMPAKTLHKPGGIIDRRKDDLYEVLEIEKGLWTEAIFIKPKPKVEKVHIDFSIEDEEPKKRSRKNAVESDDDDDDDDDIELPEEEEEEEDLPEIDDDMDRDDDEDEDIDLDNQTPIIEDFDSIDVIDDDDE